MKWPEYEEELQKRFQQTLQPETPAESAALPEIDNLDGFGDETGVLLSLPTMRTILKANRDLAAENEDLRMQCETAAPRRRSWLAGLLAAGAFVAGLVVARRRK